MGRSARSVIAGRRTASGVARMCFWISGASRSMLMTCVTRARVIPSRRAISAWLMASPDSMSASHSRALRRSSTTRGVLGYAPTRERIERSGAAGHLWKPFGDEALLDAIRKATGPTQSPIG